MAYSPSPLFVCCLRACFQPPHTHKHYRERPVRLHASDERIHRKWENLHQQGYSHHSFVAFLLRAQRRTRAQSRWRWIHDLFLYPQGQEHPGLCPHTHPKTRSMGVIRPSAGGGGMQADLVQCESNRMALRCLPHVRAPSLDRRARAIWGWWPTDLGNRASGRPGRRREGWDQKVCSITQGLGHLLRQTHSLGHGRHGIFTTQSAQVVGGRML